MSNEFTFIAAGFGVFVIFFLVFFYNTLLVYRGNFDFLKIFLCF